MKTIEFVMLLRQRNVRLWLQDHELRYAGVLSPDLLTYLHQHETEIIDFLLKAQQASRTSSSPILPATREQNIPLSFAQQRLWFLSRLNPELPIFHIVEKLALSGPLDVEALNHAFNQIRQRHEILRTAFPLSVDGTPQQVIAPSTVITLPLVDLQWLDPPQQTSTTRCLISSEAQRPFDLATGPLIRLILLRLAPQEHMLLVTTHHIISDSWSHALFYKELSRCYNAWVLKETYSPSPLPIQYADFAIWQRERLRGSTLEYYLTFWKKQLADIPTLLKLPTDFLRPAIQTHRGATYWFTLSPQLKSKLQAFSHRKEVTLFMILLAAFQLTLAHYSGQNDIVIGSPVANRTHIELNNLIGFFTNMLVLRIRLSENLTFHELLEQVRTLCLSAYAHQELPFERLVEELQPIRDLSYEPLIQVTFQFESQYQALPEFTALRGKRETIDLLTAQNDLNLAIVEVEDGQLKGRVSYNSSILKDATIKNIMHHFQWMLEHLLDTPERRITDIILVSTEERYRLLTELSPPRVSFSEQPFIHRWFERSTASTPDAVALVIAEHHITYRELNRRANQLAHYLCKRGVGPETHVGVSLERSPLLFIALLSIFKAGATFVPLDPTYPIERLAFMLTDAQMSILLTQQRLLDQLPAGEISCVVCLDDIITAQEADCDLPSSAEPENLAYVIYTSGSTGTPKGIAMIYRNLPHLITWQLPHLAIPAAAKTLQFASLNFDVSLQECFLTWCSGGKLVVLAEDMRRDPVALCRYLVYEAIERLFLPFVALQQLAVATHERNIVLPHLQEVLTAGEQPHITGVLRKFFSERRCVLHNQFGPTESHSAASLTLYPPVEDWPDLPPIGRPVINIYLLDAYLRMVPTGAAGEIFSSSDVLARGYLNRPDLTAERFLPDPFSAIPGQRMYRTGDLGRYLPDGNLLFLGRIDHQIKHHGYRIELNEIEAALSSHPGIREAVVVLRGDVPENKQLVAYVVPYPGVIVDHMTLHDFLQRKLPAYMLPTYFVPLTSLPLDANKKVDRRKLPEPTSFSFVRALEQLAPPRTPLEEILVDVWADVLGLETIGADENFFKLGGHSLLAVQVMSGIYRLFQREFPLRLLFEAPTVAEFAHALTLHEHGRDIEKIAEFILQVSQIPDEEDI